MPLGKASFLRSTLFITWLFFVFSLGVEGMVIAKEGGPVDLKCTTFKDGKVEFALTITDKRIKGVILRAMFPKGVAIVTASPAPQRSEKGLLKWFILNTGKMHYTIVVKLTKGVKESDLWAEALFKAPGAPDYRHVEAR